IDHHVSRHNRRKVRDSNPATHTHIDHTLHIRLTNKNIRIVPIGSRLSFSGVRCGGGASNLLRSAGGPIGRLVGRCRGAVPGSVARGWTSFFSRLRSTIGFARWDTQPSMHDNSATELKTPSPIRRLVAKSKKPI